MFLKGLRIGTNTNVCATLKATMNTASATKPLVYLILGATGSGRRELIADFLADALAPDARPLVLLAGTEQPDPAADAKLAPLSARWQWHDLGGGPEGMNGRIETAADADAAVVPDSQFPVHDSRNRAEEQNEKFTLARQRQTVNRKPETVNSAAEAAAATHLFFITDGRRNPVDQIEAFKPWLASIGGELARVVCVVNCQLAAQHRELTAWYEACIHFSDVVLLARRDDVPNKWISDFQARFQKKFYPCLFEFVKAGRVRNPALVLEPEARRMSHYFDDPDYALADGASIEEGIDDEDAPRKRQSDDEIEIVEEPDEYLARRAGGRRVKEIPDVKKFLA